MDILARSIVHGSVQSVAVVALTLAVDRAFYQLSPSNRLQMQSKLAEIALLAVEISAQLVVYGAIAALLFDQLIKLGPSQSDPTAGIVVSIATTLSSVHLSGKVARLTSLIAGEEGSFLGPFGFGENNVTSKVATTKTTTHRVSPTSIGPAPGFRFDINRGLGIYS